MDNEITKQQLIYARAYWYLGYLWKDIDQEIAPFLRSDIKAEQFGWMRKAREALFLSTGQVAARLKISRSWYAKLERDEINGRANLKTLRRVADAMNCELIYAIRPKSKTNFSEVQWQNLLKEGIKHYWYLSRPKTLKFQALYRVTKITQKNPKYRRRQPWTERLLRRRTNKTDYP